MSEWWRKFRNEWLRIETFLAWWLVMHVVAVAYVINLVLRGDI